MPAAVKSLKAHLGDGDPAAWRAALQVLLQAFGRPAQVEDVEAEIPDDPLDVANMTQAERRAMQSRILREHPELAPLVPARQIEGLRGLK